MAIFLSYVKLPEGILPICNLAPPSKREHQYSINIPLYLINISIESILLLVE